MKTITTIACLLLIIKMVSAQPGGGGGLHINGIYDSKAIKIDVYSDTLLKIRIFLLTDSYTIYKENYYKIPDKKPDTAYYNTTSLRWEDNLWGDTTFPNPQIQRLYITYGNDTMIVDFCNILPPNGIGAYETMDSLVIHKGYFRYDLSKRSAQEAVYTGNTPSLVPAFTTSVYGKEVLAYNKDVNLYLPDERNFPAAYFISQARFLVSDNLYNDALNAVEKAIAKNKGYKNCETLKLLSHIYKGLERYKEAAASITEAMHCERKHLYSITGNYRERIALYIEDHEWQLALQDYDTLVKMEAYDKDLYNNALLERGIFKTMYLKDASGAIQDFTTIISGIPHDHLSDRPDGVSEYAGVYFALANTEYMHNARKPALRHWITAMEFGHGFSHDREKRIISQFDSLISAWPASSSLYISRAIALYSASWDFGITASQRTTNMELGLADLDHAKTLGSHNMLVDLYSAKMLLALKKYDEALKRVNMAIDKTHNDPRPYHLRYDIRRSMGLANNEYEKDADIIRYKQLCRKWTFPK